jgi:hypothetical protein
MTWFVSFQLIIRRPNPTVWFFSLKRPVSPIDNQPLNKILSAFVKVIRIIRYRVGVYKTFLSLWLYNPSDLGRFFSFLILYTFGRIPWTGDQPVIRPLPTRKTKQTQTKRTQTFMSQAWFETATPVFERAKAVHALDHAATVIGHLWDIQGDI